jgi:hypothetical protein
LTTFTDFHPLKFGIMKTQRGQRLWRGFALLLSLNFLLLAAAAVSPGLHGHLHGDCADEAPPPEHTCVLTLIEDGLIEPVSTPERVAQAGLESTMPAPWRPVASEPTAPPFKLPWAVGPPELG